MNRILIAEDEARIAAFFGESRTIARSSLLGVYLCPGSNIIEAYVKQLRKKLGSELIETVRGAGYRLRV